MTGVTGASVGRRPDTLRWGVAEAAAPTGSRARRPWFGGKGVTDDQPLLFTEADHFVLHSDSGANLRVQMVSHVSSDGKSVTFGRDACEPSMDS